MTSTHPVPPRTSGPCSPAFAAGALAFAAWAAAA